MSAAVSGVVLDLSKRAKLRISGADALRFLNGQLTNDVRNAAADRALQASILNAKGKLNAHVFFAKAIDAFVLDADEELADTLPARLERYVIADDVVIENVTGQFSIFHFLGQPTSVENGTRILRANRFGEEGNDVWFDRNVLPAFQFEPLTGAAAEIFRIERGVPKWGTELTDEIIPIEANLEAASIDYAKGCYIGQETISRMKLSGQTNKRLCGLVSLDGGEILAGMHLTSAAEPGKVVGSLTSAARSERLGKFIALGFVKRGFNEIGHELLADAKIRVQVAALPFI